MEKLHPECSGCATLARRVAELETFIRNESADLAARIRRLGDALGKIDMDAVNVADELRRDMKALAEDMELPRWTVSDAHALAGPNLFDDDAGPYREGA